MFTPKQDRARNGIHPQKLVIRGACLKFNCTRRERKGHKGCDGCSHFSNYYVKNENGKEEWGL